jgi:CRP/FNR family transcriptional activator FtrB
MKDTPRKLLKAIPWFEGLSNRALTHLSRHCRVQRFPAGTFLFCQGEIPDFCYIALEGGIELFVTDDESAKESLVEVSNAPNAYTLAAVLLGVPYIVSGRTIAATTTLLLDARALRKSIRDNPKLAINLLGLISWQFRNMVRQVVSLKSKSTAERLGCYLLMLTEAKPEKPGRIVLPLDRKRLAAQLGMTKISLLRAFRKLSEHGVQIRGNHVVVTNFAQLRAYSRPEYLAMASGRELKLAD